MSEFTWNEDNVLDALMQFGYKVAMQSDIGITEFIKEFKKQKPLESKDWQILSFKHFSEKYNLYGSVYYRENKHLPASLNHVPTIAEITSVKVLSSGEIFSIGDKIEGFGDFPILTIDKFEIDYFDKTKIHAQDKRGYGKICPSWKKVKPILFTTEDGKPIYEGDECFGLFDIKYHFGNSRNPPIEKFKITDNPMTRVKDTLYFSTEKAAKEYILNNKPVLSLNDFKDKLGKCATDIYLLDELKGLVKQKINQ